MSNLYYYNFGWQLAVPKRMLWILPVGLPFWSPTSPGHNNLIYAIYNYDLPKVGVWFCRWSAPAYLDHRFVFFIIPFTNHIL